jgi:hypothetical protein
LVYIVVGVVAVAVVAAVVANVVVSIVVVVTVVPAATVETVAAEMTGTQHGVRAPFKGSRAGYKCWQG